MAPPDVIQHLINRFNEQHDVYTSPNYNETQTRREFIDPMFKALGWDMDNEKGFSEQWKEVVHEDALKVGGVTKAPDYAFRLGGRRLFFVEAKKPFENIRQNPEHAYQLRRYAWTAKLPVSILTDFEEFIVYDTRIRPALTDPASTGRILYIRYDEYPARWDEIASIFSPEAIQKGAFDKYIESTAKKRGTAEVDDAFLAYIEEWRELLARNIALRNPEINQRELNYAVQHTIDRIIFLRICEDRGIEEYGCLQALLNGENVYARLRVLYERADERYNSGLFHFHAERDRPGPPDELTPRLEIDDKVLKQILRGLYYPDSPYEFSVLPPEILGQVYERFLGSVIRLTSGHQAKVEQKPEVRKAGGVYYTPTYIVDYIVRQTVGKLIEGKTPQDVAGVTPFWKPAKGKRPLAILDPACGSGSFLLGAFQYLLNWHLEQYTQDPEAASRGKQPRIFKDRRGSWRLTSAERKRILLANIYGVDIDLQAVEVTKLSLLLKVLEDENAETLNQQLRLFHERALPDLARNIKCGNSLIGPDFYHNHQLDAFDDEGTYRINAFDWNAEFSEIMTSGGFDAVIGNPPYGMIRDEPVKNYIADRYKTMEGRFDNYEMFIEKGVSLSAVGGILGFIVPSTLLTNVFGQKLRRHLAKQCAIHKIVNFGYNVFAEPTVHTCIIAIERGPNKKNKVQIHQQVLSPDGLNSRADFTIEQGHLGSGENFAFDIFADPRRKALMRKMSERGTAFGEIYYIRQCIKTGNDREYVSKSRQPLPPPWVPALRGSSIDRYIVYRKDEYLKYGDWLARNWKNRRDSRQVWRPGGKSGKRRQ